MISAITTAALVTAATLASVPGAAIAYALPPRGPVAVPARWWSGAPAPIAARLAIGATTAAGAGMIAATGDRTVTTAAAHIAMAVVCVVLAVADIRRKRLPHRLTAIAWTAATVIVAAEAAANGRIDPIAEAAVTTATTAAVLFGIALMLPGQLGLGDVNLASAITFSLAWSGWTSGVVALLVGLLLQATIAASVLLAGANRETPLPLGPALGIGWLVVVASSWPHCAGGSEPRPDRGYERMP